jgi:hypothetical protein
MSQFHGIFFARSRLIGKREWRQKAKAGQRLKSCLYQSIFFRGLIGSNDFLGALKHGDRRSGPCSNGKTVRCIPVGKVIARAKLPRCGQIESR